MGISGSDLAIRHARAGVGRAGASRVNYFQPIQVIVTLGGTDISDRVDKSTLEVRLSQDDSACSFECFGVTPDIDDAVVVSIGSADNRVFSGTVVRRSMKPRARHVDRVVWRVTANGVAWQADAGLVVASYSSVRADIVVRQLVSRYASSYTAHHVQGGLDTITMDFTNERLSRCLNRIADAIGANWYWDANGDLHFFISESLGYGPATISTSTSHEWRKLTLEEDATQSISDVFVEHDVHAVGHTVDPDALGGYPLSIPLAVDDDPGWGLSTISWFFRVGAKLGTATFRFPRYETTVFGTYGVGVPFLTINNAPTRNVQVPQKGWLYVDGQWLAYAGGVGDDFNLVGVTPAPISDGAVVVFPAQLYVVTPINDPYTGERVMFQAGETLWFLSYQQASSPAITRVGYIQDGRLNRAGANARALAEVELYGPSKQTLSLESRDPNMLPGFDVAVSLGAPTSIADTFRIQRVTIKDFEDAMTKFPWREVEASSHRYDFYDILRRIERAR